MTPQAEAANPSRYKLRATRDADFDLVTFSSQLSALYMWGWAGSPPMSVGGWCWHTWAQSEDGCSWQTKVCLRGAFQGDYFICIPSACVWMPPGHWCCPETPIQQWWTEKKAGVISDMWRVIQP